MKIASLLGFFRLFKMKNDCLNVHSEKIMLRINALYIFFCLRNAFKKGCILNMMVFV